MTGSYSMHLKYHELVEFSKENRYHKSTIFFHPPPNLFMLPSSRGPGHGLFKPGTWVRIPLGAIKKGAVKILVRGSNPGESIIKSTTYERTKTEQHHVDFHRAARRAGINPACG